MSSTYKERSERMKHHILIYVNFTEVEKQDYRYWLEIMEYYLQLADTVDFHIWNEEVETIEELSVKTGFEKKSLHPMKMVSFKGKLHDKIVQIILEDCFNHNGEIKWFSIFLKKDDHDFFSSSHWGSEIYIDNPSEKEVEMIKEVLPKNATYHRFENEDNETS